MSWLVDWVFLWFRCPCNRKCEEMSSQMWRYEKSIFFNIVTHCLILIQFDKLAWFLNITIICLIFAPCHSFDQRLLHVAIMKRIIYHIHSMFKACLHPSLVTSRMPYASNPWYLILQFRSEKTRSYASVLKRQNPTLLSLLSVGFQGC